VHFECDFIDFDSTTLLQAMHLSCTFRSVLYVMVYSCEKRQP